ncbi:MerR family transcriptional regulator [Micromonospora sp. NPDC023956]|uniref:MerR family transcriptional regulator n=1 Tax=Micromonospora sp. NPDC023956 TaxID=3155722 RepID=UPI00340102E5
MRSRELATLAGVTVRTLRHYHQIGILDEPRRSSNGYREYDVHHLIRVLRIKRLAALGVPLTALPDVLDDPADAAPLLDQLDRELAAEIERLTARRAVVARLRRDRGAPDLPQELARYPVIFAAAGLPPALARFDREQLILLGHLAGESGMSTITGFYQRLTDPALLDASMALNARFHALTPDSSDDDIEQLADDLVATVAPAVRAFLAEHPTLDLGDAAPLVEEYTNDVLNEAQRRAAALVEERLARAVTE